MSFVRLTKIFTFETSHFLYNYNGLCKNIHGHSYKFYVTIGGNVKQLHGDTEDGMVADFTSIKKIVNQFVVDEFDHALVVNGTVTDLPLQLLNQVTQRIIQLPFQPTCENLICHFAELLNVNMPEGILLMELKLFETASSYAEWRREENI
jgi:6-pyruvoyltetrahydropterin/6-carboxytetrahydropterin synthase